VKIYLLYNDQRIAKKKTHVKKRTLNPVFNESFVFELPHLGDDGLKNVSLEFMLLDWDRVTKNEVKRDFKNDVTKLYLCPGSICRDICAIFRFNLAPVFLSKFKDPSQAKTLHTRPDAHPSLCLANDPVHPAPTPPYSVELYFNLI
jgi:hypothetical protein